MRCCRGIIEKVNETMDDGNIGNITYLPHRQVIRQDKKSTAIRTVFDASTKGKNGISLNDCLYKGPCLNPMLSDLFRAHPIAITADVEKAFYRFPFTTTSEICYDFYGTMTFLTKMQR